MSKLFEPVESKENNKKAEPDVETTYAVGEEFPY